MRNSFLMPSYPKDFQQTALPTETSLRPGVALDDFMAFWTLAKTESTPRAPEASSISKSGALRRSPMPLENAGVYTYLYIYILIVYICVYIYTLLYNMAPCVYICAHNHLHDPSFSLCIYCVSPTMGDRPFGLKQQ